MSTLSITSPGVQINEVDLSVISRPIGTTDVLVTGFASQGPTEEFVNIGSVSEYESIFGTPTNAAERYLYHSAKQILNNSPANLLVTRLPYGANLGQGYGNQYSALVYPISTNKTTFEASSAYSLQAPVSILLTEDEYNLLLSNDVTWSDSAYTYNGISYSNTLKSINSFADIGNAGLVVLNSSKTTINNFFEGYYVGITDNVNINPATPFNSVTGVKTVDSSTNLKQLIVDVPSKRLNFALSAESTNFSRNSISEIIETYPTGYDLSSSSFVDSLVVVAFKIKTSVYNSDTVLLDYSVAEGYAGSLYSARTQNNPNGGIPNTFFLDNVVDKRSNNFKIITNPNISSLGEWTNTDGTPAKKVTVSNAAKNLYGSGVYISDTDTATKDVGNIPQKLERVLNQLQNNDTISLDVVVEAGLGTIWASAKAKTPSSGDRIFDEEYNLALGDLLNTTTGSIAGAGADYLDAITPFVELASKSRKDHVFIADPIRNIFVKGMDSKISAKKNYIFSSETYWPLRNQFSGIESSYVVTYGNWMKVNDSASDKKVWVPSSGFVAAAIASSSQQSYPWTSVAGFNRGTLNGILDLAINPTQKQRDLLYKININPIAFFPNDGYVIYGQKTLFRKPSAFDRLNVRRLFLTLEKEAQGLLKYFVFEPNSFTTRTRLVGALQPIFDQAKISDGLYDYTIVCDERNNTPDIIDNNELKVSLYIQPVRTAEFILADFIATRTGVDFNELIG